MFLNVNERKKLCRLLNLLKIKFKDKEVTKQVDKCLSTLKPGKSGRPKKEIKI